MLDLKIVERKSIKDVHMWISNHSPQQAPEFGPCWEIWYINETYSGQKVPCSTLYTHCTLPFRPHKLGQDRLLRTGEKMAIVRPHSHSFSIILHAYHTQRETRTEHTHVVSYSGLHMFFNVKSRRSAWFSLHVCNDKYWHAWLLTLCTSVYYSCSPHDYQAIILWPQFYMYMYFNKHGNAQLVTRLYHSWFMFKLV